MLDVDWERRYLQTLNLEDMTFANRPILYTPFAIKNGLN